MKTLIFSVIIPLIFTLDLFSQQYEDVIYLKNGSILRGTIIEQVLNESVKLKTNDNNILVFKIDEIEKITKEAKANSKDNESISEKLKNRTSGFFFRVDAEIGFPVGDGSEGWDILFGNNFHLGHIFSRNFIASGNFGWDMWTATGGSGYEIYWGGSLMAGEFKNPIIYFARFGGGGQVNFPPVGGGEVGGNLVFGGGFGFKLNKKYSGAIIIEPLYHMSLNEVLPNSFRIGIGFMTTL